ncbi:MAG TPA: NAD(P)/FAD-dependent oxidoreductase [Blastocatellia bacterium]|nr:NAD(P)/FAD-dependent oxidoreductase [Blastocatellia bacterium]
MDRYDVIVVGAGPAGSTAASVLASLGVRTLLLEEKRMPREKVCGEFITPECFPTLRRLAVFDRILEAGAQRISTVTLSAPGKGPVETTLAGMSTDGYALGLSRSRFDHILFQKAQESGARCLEGIAVKGCLYDADPGFPSGVECLSLDSGRRVDFKAPVVIDASGRNSRLMVEPGERPAGARGSRRYAMKVHLTGVGSAEGKVQLFFFPGGYGGLSPIENGLANLCFITSDKNLHDAGGEPSKVLQNSLFQDDHARTQLTEAKVDGKWHTVGPLSFGKRRLNRAGVLATGDSAGMIDPFTGTGIQVALRSGEMLAESIFQKLSASARAAFVSDTRSSGITSHSVRSAPSEPPFKRHLNSDNNGLISSIQAEYERMYADNFGQRMFFSGLLRRVAFSQSGRSLAAFAFGAAPWLTRRVLKATRSI